MDLTESIAPKSDQLDAEDLLTGPRLVTIAAVREGPSKEQPVNVYLREFDRPWRPSKTVRRILVAAWGAEASAYTGRRLVIYRDPEVRFGGMAVGGIRVSHMSHIEQRFTIALASTRGKRSPHIIEPLPKEGTPDRRRPDFPTRGRRSPENHDTPAPTASEAGEKVAPTAPASDPSPDPGAGAASPASPAPAPVPSIEDQRDEVRQLAEQHRADPGMPLGTAPADTEVLTPRDEDYRTKMVSPGQRGFLMAQFKRLKVEDRQMRLAYSMALTGRDNLESSNQLTFNQASELIKALEKCRDLDALEQLANGQESLT